MILLHCFAFERAHFILLVILRLPGQSVDPLCCLHGSSSENAENRNVVPCHTSGKRSCSEAASLGGQAPSQGTLRPFLLVTSIN